MRSNVSRAHFSTLKCASMTIFARVICIIVIVLYVFHLSSALCSIRLKSIVLYDEINLYLAEVNKVCFYITKTTYLSVILQSGAWPASIGLWLKPYCGHLILCAVILTKNLIYFIEVHSAKWV